MRIPFDLLAALLALETVRELYNPDRADAMGCPFQTTTAQAGFALCCFWAIAWLLHELVARRAEWAMRWGVWPQGFRIFETPDGRFLGPPRRHPLETHARQAAVAQLLTVVLYVTFISVYAWPCKTAAWPDWLGLDRFLSPGTCYALKDSYFVRGMLDLGPFAIAMVLALLPRHRVLRAEEGRRAGVWKWLAFELRLTFPPLVLWFVFYACFDVLALTVPEETAKTVFERPWLAVLLGGAALVFFAVAVMPRLMVWFWRARPMADGELKDRMAALLKRSGVKARAILEWGPGETGFANACVLGPWAPFRYILISPGLMRLLTLEECEAVIAHEIGHVRHGHLGLLVFVILGLAAWSDVILRGMEALGYKGPVEQGAVLMLLIVIYLRLLFGVIMRRCERQSDLSAAELMGTPAPLISALEKLALLSGNIREVYSWHHDSIARRVERLSTEGLDPDAMRRYHRVLRRMRWGLLGFSAVAVGLMLGLALTDPDESAGKEPEEAPPAIVFNVGERRPGHGPFADRA